ncbi:MAG: hypothetical protein RR092_06070, partial [Oscillospiraceae bacterium]
NAGEYGGYGDTRLFEKSLAKTFVICLGRAMPCAGKRTLRGGYGGTRLFEKSLTKTFVICLDRVRRMTGAWFDVQHYTAPAQKFQIKKMDFP